MEAVGSARLIRGMVCVGPLPLTFAYHPSASTAEAQVGPLPELTMQHHALKMRLSPLHHVQTVLIEHLANQFDDPSLLIAAQQFSVGAEKMPDFVVKSNSTLNGFLGKAVAKDKDHEEESPRVRLDIREIDAVLEACREDMELLWKDATVREILHRRDVRLEEGPGK